MNKSTPVAVTSKIVNDIFGSDSENEDFQDAQEEIDEVLEKFKDVAIDNVESGATDKFFMSQPFDENMWSPNENSDRTNPVLVSNSDVPDSKKTDKRKSLGRSSDNPKKMKTQVSLGMKIESTISEWFTLESLVFVYGEDEVKEKFKKFGSPLNETQFNQIRDTYVYERYEEICRWV